VETYKHHYFCCLFRDGAHDNPGPDSVSYDFSAWFGSWLAVCPQQVITGADFVSWAG
jgi:hypothetical protein